MAVSARIEAMKLKSFDMNVVGLKDKMTVYDMRLISQL